MPWLVAATNHREETRAQENLVRIGFNTLLPLVLVKHVSMKHGEEIKESVLFTGYIFIEFDASELWKKIASTRGVKRVLMEGLKPVPLRDPEVERLAARCANGPFKDYEEAEKFVPIKPEQEGLIQSGSFEGHTGRCIGISAKQNTATLELWMFKRRTEVTVPRNFVKAVAAV